MSFTRRWFAVACVVWHLLRGAFIVKVRFPSLTPRAREAMVRWWSLVILRYCGVTVQIIGSQNLREDGHMLVANHVSWLDVYVLNAYRATSFVAKSEIRHWPLIGWLCEMTGTMFLERDRRRALQAVIDTMCSALKGGRVVGVFAEGTTTDGGVLLPFHSNLLQAACNVGAPIVPVAIRYLDRRGAMSYSAAYIGDMTLFQSLMLVLAGAPITAQVLLLDQIDPTLGRREVALMARQRIGSALEL